MAQRMPLSHDEFWQANEERHEILFFSIPLSQLLHSMEN
jgi:hypothetical protein